MVTQGSVGSASVQSGAVLLLPFMSGSVCSQFSEELELGLALQFGISQGSGLS